MKISWDNRSWWRMAVATVFMSTLVACGGGSAGGGDENDDDDNRDQVAQNVAPVANAGSDLAITAGERVQLDASASYDSDGQIVSYAWSNNLQGAQPFVQYSVPGNYSLSLTVTDNEGLQSVDILVITVMPSAESSKPERIEIHGSSLMFVGNVQGFSADIIYDDGSVANDVEWSSSASNVATISAFGVVTAHSDGQTTITATKRFQGGQVSESLVLTVTTLVGSVTPTPQPEPPLLSHLVISGQSSVGIGSSVQLAAALHYQNGTVSNNGNVLWSVDNALIASVNAQGIVVGESVGSATITATAVNAPNISDTFVVTVISGEPLTVDSIVISGSASIDLGDSVSLNAQVNYSDGSIGNTVNWRSENSDIATVNTSGVVTARDFGQTNIVAESGGVQSMHSINVVDGDTDLVSIEIFPKTLRLNHSNPVQQAVAVGTNVHGNKLPLTHLVEWSVSNDAIAQVNSTGLVTILDNASGSVELRARFSGVEGSFDIEEQDRLYTSTNVFFQKPDAWQDANMYVWVDGGLEPPRGGWPGGAMDSVEDVNGWYYVEILPEYVSSDGLVHFKFASTNNDAHQSPVNLSMNPDDGHLWFTDASTSTDVAPEWMDNLAPGVLVSVARNEIIFRDGQSNENLAGQAIAAGLAVNIEPGTIPTGRTFREWGGSAAPYVVDPTAANTKLVVANVGEMELEAEFNIQASDGFEQARDDYATQCAHCHGDSGEGTDLFTAVTLSELQLSWAEKGNPLTVDTLAEFISNQMPSGSASVNCTGVSSGDCAYDIAAMIFADAWVNENSIAIGEELYGDMCSTCHGENGEGSPGIFPSLRECPSCTSESLWTRIALTMPPSNVSGSVGPHDCDEDCARAVADYVLYAFQEDVIAYECQSDDYRSREVKLLSELEYRNTVKALFNLNDDQLPNTDFLNRPPVNGFKNNADIGIVTANLLESALGASQQIIEAASANNYLGCDANDASCVLDTFGTKVFRRPMTLLERGRYLDLFNQYDSDTAIIAMLASSSFLYRTELGAMNSNSAIVSLTDYEIASALSYALTASMPDDVLLAAAASGDLSTSAQIRSQVQRVLQTAAARTNVGNFVAQWLGADSILSVNKEEELLSPSIRNAMLQETYDFAAHVIFDSTGMYGELFTSDYTVVSQELANFYGFDGNGGVTQYPENTRAGLLGHASILAAHSAYDQTSPIKRGLFVRQKLLCQTFPDPPNDVVVMAPKLDPNLTTRERFEQHTENPVCATCHQYIDELGFGFENFDTYGQYRLFENDFPIDASGDLNNVEDLTGDPVSNLFDGLVGMAGIVADSDRGKACYALNYYRYTYGAREDEVDNCNLEPLSDQFIESDGDVLEFMERLLSDDSFITRKRTL